LRRINTTLLISAKLRWASQLVIAFVFLYTSPSRHTTVLQTILLNRNGQASIVLNHPEGKRLLCNGQKIPNGSGPMVTL
jgi:hypothetical protein